MVLHRSLSEDLVKILTNSFLSKRSLHDPAQSFSEDHIIGDPILILSKRSLSEDLAVAMS